MINARIIKSLVLFWKNLRTILIDKKLLNGPKMIRHNVVLVLSVDTTLFKIQQRYYNAKTMLCVWTVKSDL